MAITKTIVIKADTSDAVKSFDDLTESIDKQEKELVKLQSIYDKAPAAKNQALKKRIDKLSGSIDKQKESVSKLTKAQAKANTVRKSTLSSVRDNGGAIAVLDSVTGGLATRVRDAAEASSLFNINLKAMRGALIATGIGAFVVLLGLVVAHWDDIVDFVNQTTKKLKEQVDLQNEIGDQLEGQLKTLELQKKIAEKLGEDTSEILEIEKELLARRQQSNAELIISLSALLEIENTRIREIGLWDKIKASTALALGGVTNYAKAIQNSAIGTQSERDNRKKIVQDLKDAQDEALRLQIAYIDLNKSLNPEEGEGEDEIIRGQVTSLNVLSEEDIQLQLDSEKALQDASTKQLDEFLIQQADLREAAAIAQSETEITWAELTAQAKLGIAGAILQDAAQLVDQNSVAGKGIAIAQTGINTAQGIMQAFATLPTIAAIPAAAIVGALGIKSTIDIVKKKIPSATGRGFVGGGAGAGSAAPSAPSFNLVEGTSDSQINDSINLQNNQPIEAVVVSGNVTSAQSVDRNIVDGSGL